MEKHAVNRPLRRPTCRWEYDIKMDLERSRMGRRGLNTPGSE